MCEKYLNHIHERIDGDIENFVNDVVLYSANYIFYKTIGRKQEAYCTRCKTDFITSGLKHNEFTECPYCTGKYKAKAEGRGRKGLIDKALFIWYDKSYIDNQAVTARGYLVERVWSNDYRKVENEYIPLAYYIFKENEAAMLKRNYWYSYDGMGMVGGWSKTKSIYSFNNNSLAPLPYYSSIKNITETVKDSYFKYSCCENYYDNGDMTKFFETYIKYPGIEQLTKVGLGNLVYSKLNDKCIGRTINWRGKDIYKMLKLSKKDYRIMMKSNVCITPTYLELYQINSKYEEKDRLSPSEVKDLEYIVQNWVYIDAFKQVLRYSTPKKIYKYINKQFKNRESGKFTSAGIVLNDWRDYIGDCNKLDIPLFIENNLYPRDLFKAHDNTMKQVKIKQNEMLDMKIAERLEKLNNYYFEYKGLVIRPAVNTLELIEEGKKQDICIGGYGERYAEGRTNLFLIRKIGEADKPYYAVEINNNNKIIQVRGKRNIAANEEVEEFIKQFEKNILNKSNKKVA
ncbi:MAG: PcfJ domain-containing protein [Clostridium sp.]|nr:PcfJ domain-containing protein [Clostridium sp.]